MWDQYKCQCYLLNRIMHYMWQRERTKDFVFFKGLKYIQAATLENFNALFQNFYFYSLHSMSSIDIKSTTT